MGLSAVTGGSTPAPLPPVVAPAGAGAQATGSGHAAGSGHATGSGHAAGLSNATGLSKQDQLAVIGARPQTLHRASLVAAKLASSNPTDPASTGSASSQGALDTYL